MGLTMLRPKASACAEHEVQNEREAQGINVTCYAEAEVLGLHMRRTKAPASAEREARGLNVTCYAKAERLGSHISRI